MKVRDRKHLPASQFKLAFCFPFLVVWPLCNSVLTGNGSAKETQSNKYYSSKQNVHFPGNLCENFITKCIGMAVTYVACHQYITDTLSSRVRQ
mmetsp:Transcript_22669/g.38791  ORF Transcript_22669/g.38791 Transcript_22669/m.38791 type:complete len:93 (-) Transcript_22669:388-666(-)